LTNKYLADALPALCQMNILGGWKVGYGSKTKLHSVNDLYKVE